VADPIVMKLSEPVQFGSERIEELVLKPTAKAMLGLKMTMRGSDFGGGGGFEFEPYTLARVGIVWAARPYAVLDLMTPPDVSKLGFLVLGFIMPSGPETGTGPSP
jgi:hypothetical protein